MINSEEHTWCIQGLHSVPVSKISYLMLPNGNRKRMCSDCKSKSMDRRKLEKQERARIA